VAIATHCNSLPTDFAPVVLGFNDEAHNNASAYQNFNTIEQSAAELF